MQAVIVFRGTENDSGQLVDDWSANLASAFNSVPGQFKEVEGVRAAYAFNTSPVAGWAWLRTRQRLHPEVMPVQDPQIIRVTLGSGLAPTRPTRWFAGSGAPT